MRYIKLSLDEEAHKLAMISDHEMFYIFRPIPEPCATLGGYQTTEANQNIFQLASVTNY